MSDPSGTDLSVNLIRTLLSNLKVQNDGWTLLSIVIGIDEDFEPNTTYGYVYDGPAGPPIAASANTISITDAVNQYLVDLYGSDKQPPVKMLVQFNKDSGQYNIEFEDDDEDRWQVTPSNLDSVREELRPKL